MLASAPRRRSHIKKRFLSQPCNYQSTASKQRTARHRAKRPAVFEQTTYKTSAAFKQRSHQEVKMRTCAPALHLVLWGGRRIDEFLSARNAKACAERLTNAK